MNKEFLHMQKLAGIITEGEYNAKMNEEEGNESTFRVSGYKEDDDTGIDMPVQVDIKANSEEEAGDIAMEQYRFDSIENISLLD
jgi:hypothetical protein